MKRNAPVGSVVVLALCDGETAFTRTFASGARVALSVTRPTMEPVVPAGAPKGLARQTQTQSARATESDRTIPRASRPIAIVLPPKD